MGWGYWFCKMKVLCWFNYADYGELRFRDSALITGGKVEKEGAGKSWAPGEGGNWIRPCHSGPNAATAPKKSPRPWPWLDRVSGLTSDQYHCCPDPSRQSPIQAAPVHLQEKTRQTLMQIQRVGSHLPVFPQTIPGHGRKILPPSAGSGLQANCRDRLPSDTRSIWSWNVPSPNN